MPSAPGIKQMIIRQFCKKDTEAAIVIWNEVVKEAVAFPQEDLLTERTGEVFFEGQSYTGVAEEEKTGEIVGLYILHPNNVGRCGHICNCSYAVRSSLRGQHIGERLVKDSLLQGKAHGFRILQFNAVVASNKSALHLYKRLGFTPLGVIPGGFRRADGRYEDIIPHYIEL